MIIKSACIASYPDSSLDQAFLVAYSSKLSLYSFDKCLTERISRTYDTILDSIAYYNNLLVVGNSKLFKGILNIHKIDLEKSAFESVLSFGNDIGRPIKILYNKENLIVLHAGISIYSEDYKEINKTTTSFNQIANNPHNSNYIIGANNSLHLLDIRIDSLATGIGTAACHKGNVTSLDINPNVESSVITSGIDGHLALWDLRSFDYPIKISRVSDSWITSVRYNPYHDQLILISDTSGAIKLLNSGFESIDRTKAKSPVYNVCWSSSDPWTYSYLEESIRPSNFQICSVPKETKYKILLDSK